MSDHRWKHVFQRLRMRKRETMRAKAGPEPAPLMRRKLQHAQPMPVSEVRGGTSRQQLACVSYCIVDFDFPLVKLRYVGGVSERKSTQS